MLTATATPILRPFRASDATVLTNRDGAQVSHALLIAQAAAGPAFTAEVEGIPIGCAGLVLLWPGVGSAWMVISEDIGPYALWITRTVKHFLQDMETRYTLHRIEAIALEDSPRNQLWLTELGFHVEPGIATAYFSDRRSAIRYERIKD